MTETAVNETTDRSHDFDLIPLYVLVALKLLFHLAVNTWGGYGIFRDELYYLACADHPAWGYVDHPPLSIFLLGITRAVLGDSLFALRLVPAIAGAAVVLITGLLARELGGGRLAVTLAALGSIVAGFHLGVSSIWSMNIFDLLLVALASYSLARLLRTENPRWWLAIGATLGLGLLNKTGVLWVGLGVFVGIAATRERRWLRTWWPWAGGAIAAALFSPYLVWNAVNGWPHLEFIDSAVNGKYAGLTPWSFLSGQVLMQNPVNLPLWIAGLVWLLFASEGRRFRPIGIVWLAACLVLIVNWHSKAEYLASAYAALFAAGGVAWEKMLPRRLVLRGAAVVTVASGLLLAPLATPMLPVASYVRYANALGIAPGTDEGHELGELPQFYADMFGWEEKARAVAEVYHALPEEDRRRAAIFASNYGRSGAIDYFADEYDLPGAIGNHNNYWLWGPGSATGEVVVFLGGEVEDLEERFESVDQAGVARCDDCIPYERDLPIYVGRGLRLTIEELWPLVKHYD